VFDRVTPRGQPRVEMHLLRKMFNQVQMPRWNEILLHI
jgi:hypothetical protein